MPAVTDTDTLDCTPFVSSLQPPVTGLSALQRPAYTARMVSYVLPNVLAVSVPVVGAVNRYHTLRARLRLPQLGDGSVGSVVAVAVEVVLEYGAALMVVALPHASLETPGVGVEGRGVWVRVGVDRFVAVAVAEPPPEVWDVSWNTSVPAPAPYEVTKK